MSRLKNFVFVLLAFSAVFGKGLNANANYIKTNFQIQYEDNLKSHALEKWNTDYSMVVYEINKQADAIFHLVKKFESQHTAIAFQAIQKWSIDSYKNENVKLFQEISTFGIEELLKMHCDWTMVEYEYDKQVEAKNSF